MKKIAGVFIISLLLVSLSLNLVAASPVDDLQGFGNGVYELIKPVLFVLTGETSDTGDFFARVLFLIIVFSVVWASLNGVAFFNETTWVLWSISIAVSILAVRFIGDTSIVQTIILPYSAFGVALTAGIPFVLFFFIVKDFNLIARKISWIFFGVVFLGLWYTRSAEIGEFSYIYLITAVVSLMVLLFDKTIQKAITKSRYQANREIQTAKIRSEISNRRYELEQKNLKGIITPADYKRLDKELQALEKKYGIKYT